MQHQPARANRDLGGQTVIILANGKTNGVAQRTDDPGAL